MSLAKSTQSPSAAPAYLRAADLDAALACLAREPRTVLAGGTDLYALRPSRSLPGAVLDIDGLAALRGLREADAAGEPALHIGALTTWSEIAHAPLPAGMECLRLAAGEIGGAQVQNRGTLGGNVCNASPAADGIPALLALDARVQLASAAGRRELRLDEFVLGNRRTRLAPGELLTGFVLPRRSRKARSLFLKLGSRRYLVIAIAMVAVALDFDEHDRVCSSAIAVGACAPRTLRLRDLELSLITTPRERLAERAAQALSDPAALAPLRPIDDVRGSAAYRLSAVAELLARAVAELSQSQA